MCIVLVIDKSGSMCEKNKLEFAIEGAKVVINMVEERDYMGIVVFDSNATVLSSIQNCSKKNKSDLIMKVNNLRPGSSTNMIGGLSQGIKMCKMGKENLTRRVILLSDGLPDNSNGLENIASSERKNGITVSTIGLGLDFNEQLMQSIAQHGGGNYYYVNTPSQLPGVFSTEFSLAKDIITEKTVAFVIYNQNYVLNVRINGYNTHIVNKNDFVFLKKDINELGCGSEEKDVCCMMIDMSDLVAEEERAILIHMNVNAIEYLKRTKKTEGQNIMEFGKFVIKYKKLNEKEEENKGIWMNVSINEDKETREKINEEDEGGRRRVMIVEDEEYLNEAHDQAMEEMERGRIHVAQNILKSKQREVLEKQRSYRIQKNEVADKRKKRNLVCSSNSSSASSSSMNFIDFDQEERDADEGIMLMDEQNLRYEQSMEQMERAINNYNLQSDMIKQSKCYSYASAQGQKSAIKQKQNLQPQSFPSSSSTTTTSSTSSSSGGFFSKLFSKRK
jgi:hypothetical protein